jgi:polyhydroxybutyrate depolymerase
MFRARRRWQIPIQTSIPDVLQPGDFDLSLSIGGYDRHYVVHVPASYHGAPLPLLIMLHGAGGNGQNALNDCHWINASDNSGFIVVGPDALPFNPRRREGFVLNPSVWRDGSGRASHAENIDDVAFIGAILDKMQTSAAIDPLRIYIAGHSSGASMAYQLGVHLSDRIAAIAAISGHLWLPDPLKLSYPVSLLLLDGTLDPLNPPNGGTVKMPWGNVENKPPMLESFNRWANLLNCGSAPVPFDNHDRVSGLNYRSCDGRSEAVYYLIDGLGHGWPGGINRLPPRLIGPSSTAIDATSTIWSFFQRHPRMVVPA